MIHGPTWVVKSATDGGFTPFCCAASIDTMNRASVTIAHSQHTPTIASAPSRTLALTSPACSRPSSMTPEGGRWVSGAVIATTIMTITSPAMIQYTVPHGIRAASSKAKAPPTIEAIR